MSLASYEGFRAAVVGSCQSPGLADWLRLYLPGAEILAWHVHVAPSALPDVVRPQIEGCDLVVTQFAEGMDGGPLAHEQLRETFPRVVFMPIAVFKGFHPDTVNCWTETQPVEYVRGPMDLFHSAVVVAAFKLGLPAARVPRLFNALVFGRAGYFDAFPLARAAFLKVFAEEGYELGESFDAWLRDGQFMYLENHPHIRVLGSFARMILAKAGLEAAELPPGVAPRDRLADSIHWPAYPAIARRIGIGGAGTGDFILAGNSPVTDPARRLGLPAFIDASYAAYAKHGADALACDLRVSEIIDRLSGVLHQETSSV